MQGFWETFLSVVPVLSLFLVGFFLKKGRFFHEASVGDIKKIVVYITLPCLLFLAFSRIKLELNLLVIFVTVFFICLLMVFYGRLSRKIFDIRTPYFTPLMVGYETGMVGYAIFISAYGMEAVGRFAAVDLGQLLFVWFVLIGPLIALRDGHKRSGRVIRTFVTSPVVIGIFLGIAAGVLGRVYGFSGTAQYGEFLKLLTLVANLTMPLICIAIGYELIIEPRTLKLTLITLVLRIVPQVCLALLINKLVFVNILDLDIMYQRALLTMFLLPPPFVYTLFIREGDRENQRYISSTLSLHTIVSVVLFIFAAALYR